MNVFHVYHICDQYFYYDVTTNVRIGFPEVVEFPSMTLCPVLVNLLKWEKMSTDLRRNLLQVALSTPTNETLVSQLLNNASLIGPEVFVYDAWTETAYNMYNRLVKEVSVGMIFKLTAPFHEVFPFFTTIGLTHNSFGSDEQKTKEELPTSGKFQFTIDSTFIHDRYKCWTLNIRPELNKVKFDELQAIYVQPKRFMASWYSYVTTDFHVYIHNKGFLINTIDDKTIVKSGSGVETSFISHESIFLEYPYKTNCRDYTKIGFTSRKHCKEMCFKSKTIQRYKALVEDTHAFQSDNMFFNQSQYPWTERSTVRFFIRQCMNDCKERDCRSVTYHKGDSFYAGNEKFSGQRIYMAYNVITFTKTQAAFPLVSFLTELFSTFGFWMGLSVANSLKFVKGTWKKLTSSGHQRKSRERLTLQQPIDQRIIRLMTHMDAILQQMHTRQRINALNIQSRVRDH